MIDHPRRSLNNGVQIPAIGLGVYRSEAGRETEQAIACALAAGYRHIDTAAIYGNEASVGRAIRHSELARDETFVTTKLWRDDVGYDSGLEAMATSLDRLGLDYVDLYLMHWPTPERRLEGWRAMERLLAEGKTRAIGVSNFMVHHLEELLAASEVVPAINQIELSPYNVSIMQPVLDYCTEHGIAIEAYSPLTKGQRLGDPRLAEIAGQVGRTPAQVLIRWVLQKGCVVLPKSVRRARIIENADVLDFDLAAAQMATLDGLDEALITGWDPTQAP